MDKIRKYAILISTLLLCGMLLMFFQNLRPRFNKVESDYKADQILAVNLSKKTDKQKLSQILTTNGYVKNPKDAHYAADTLVERLKRGMKYPNLYHLQKRDYGKVPALIAEKDSVFTDVLNRSYGYLGLTEMDSLTTGVADSLKVPVLDTSPVNVSQLDSTRKDGIGQITVRVYEKEEKSRGKVLDKLLKPKKVKKASKGVCVCLKEYDADSENLGSVLVYAKTDSNGCVVFTHLDTTKGYSVLPIQKGYEYGSSKGIVQHKFEEYKYFGRFRKVDYVFNFEQLEHRIQMIDNSTIKQIKNDSSITIRTPQEFKSEVIKRFVFILLAWWFLVFVLVRRKRSFDPILIATAMFLTGLCVIVMYAIQNPLTEELRGTEMASGVLIGVLVILLLQFVDFVRLYQDKAKLDFDIPLVVLRWLFLPFKQKVSWLAPVLSGSAPWYKKLGAMLLLLCCLPFAVFNIPVISKINKPILRLIDRLPKGFGWLLLAIFLTILLFTPLGKEIGGMKVNLVLLGLTFQPSEIAKYLILFFMAAFFTQNADSIIAYSQPDRTQMLGSVWNKVKTLGWVIGGLLMLMFLYAILGDMGPALVIGVTFVLLYSLVKSKVNLDNLDEDDKWKRIFTCDFAMLIYGVASFAAFVFVGYLWSGAETALLFAGLWFLGWIVFGVFYHKQFFETAFIINLLVFMFVFGGDVMKQIPALSDTDIAERFEQRTRMCTNTWGDLNIDHHQDEDEPVSNTQVANGLWAIATGGVTGQGLGEGNPNLIPAFHTDMILSSIAEQIGWLGLLLVVFVFALLLRRIIVVGYRVGHPFAFYFCMGVAIVTAVQFFIIALGSSGMIPLTGITVPFLSYGRVSMILNLAAVGVVISLSKNIKEEELSAAQEQVRQRSVGDYNYPISIVTWTYITIAAFTLCVWQYYALWRRGNTLIHPAYVHSSAGLPMIEYNPRIALITKEMWAGDIYDRKGVLLATSDVEKLKANISYLCDTVKLNKDSLNSIAQAHTKRYYPFAEHLFFMLGDLNSGLFLHSQIGYMAEGRHLSYLRNYDNLHNRKGEEIPRPELLGRLKANSRYLNNEYDTLISVPVYDNHELIKFLITGVHGRPLKNHNENVHNGKYDLHLTLDAKLQKDMQDSIKNYVARTTGLKDNKLLRVSVVVLDAQNGDLLTSANYPLPDQVRLRAEEDDARAKGRRFAVWSDNYQEKGWETYTDRDLGLTYQTMPGSTAKVMSAMAGLNKLGVGRVRREAIFPVYRYEVIDINNKTKKSKEPPMGFDAKAMVSMKDAIVLSSNCYFINLVNHYDCYNELAKIYAAVGVSLNKKCPYSFYYQPSDVLNGIIAQTQLKAVPSYKKYLEKREAGKFIMDKDWKTMRKDEWMWAWGQGTMDASPLNMARVVSVVANNGRMPITHYLMQTADKKKKEVKPEYVSIMEPANANELKTYMQAQAKEHGFVSYVGGKTGTPERTRKISRKGNWVEKREINDGWYIMYVETGNDKCPVLAVAIRMERVGNNVSTFNSAEAMKLAKSVVLDVLGENKYIKQIN